jgi:hypothetical protein
MHNMYACALGSLGDMQLGCRQWVIVVAVLPDAELAGQQQQQQQQQGMELQPGPELQAAYEAACR